MGERKNDVVRPRDDFYPTPRPAVEALLRGGPILGPTHLPHAVWEPACGDGAIARVLEDRGHRVVSTDLNDHGYGLSGIDFLKIARIGGSVYPRCIVTNPPFSLADQFWRHAMDLGVDVVALFVRLAFLEGMKRREMFLRAPPYAILVFSDRVTLAPKGSGITKGSPTAYVWFLWRRGYRGTPMIDWITTREPKP